MKSVNGSKKPPKNWKTFTKATFTPQDLTLNQSNPTPKSSTEEVPGLSVPEKKQNEKQKRAAWFRELKSQMKCAICGEERDVCLEFHHDNPKEKEFRPSRGIYMYGKARIKRELDKCTVLCSNCHRVLHHNQRHPDNPFPLGEINAESGQFGSFMDTSS